jgi:hypothetical protein
MLLMRTEQDRSGRHSPGTPESQTAPLTGSWWDAQLDLCLIAIMATYGDMSLGRLVTPGMLVTVYPAAVRTLARLDIPDRSDGAIR